MRTHIADNTASIIDIIVINNIGRIWGNVLLAINQLNKEAFFVLKEAPVSNIQLQYQGFEKEVRIR